MEMNLMGCGRMDKKMDKDILRKTEI